MATITPSATPTTRDAEWSLRTPFGRPDGRARLEHATQRTRGISLLIPAVNEAGALPETIAKAREVLSAAGIPAEIVVIDDGSQDDTADSARSHGATVIRHLYNRGYGHALRSGILASRYENIVICDADGTYPLDRIPDLLAELNRGYDLVIGARTGKHFRGSWIKDISRRIFLKMCQSASGTKIPDANSGLRIFRKKAIAPHLHMMCGGFSFTTSQTLSYLLLSRSVSFIPVEYYDRVGRTKVRHIQDSIRTAQYIFQMYVIFNPVKLFTLMAFVPFVGALLALATQAGLSLSGVGGDWGTTALLASGGFGLSLVLMGLGLSVFGSTRQKWPEVVSGQEIPQR